MVAWMLERVCGSFESKTGHQLATTKSRRRRRRRGKKLEKERREFAA